MYIYVCTLTYVCMKMDGWKASLSFWDGPFSGAFAVSFGRVYIYIYIHRYRYLYLYIYIYHIYIYMVTPDLRVANQGNEEVCIHRTYYVRRRPTHTQENQENQGPCPGPKIKKIEDLCLLRRTIIAWLRSLRCFFRT